MSQPTTSAANQTGVSQADSSVDAMEGVKKYRSILLQPERDEIKQLQEQIDALTFR